MKNLIFILLTIIVINNLHAQSGEDTYRRVYWVYGLSGSLKSWNNYSEHYATQYAPNHVKCKKIPDYGEYGTLETASTTVADFIHTNNVGLPMDTIKRNICVGHSQGGLVSRAVDKYRPYDNHPGFGGLITVGSPNYGVKIVTSVKNGNMDKFATSMCEELVAGPKSESFLLELVLHRVLNDSACYIFNDIVNLGLGSFKTELMQDYKINGNGINVLNNYNSFTKKVGIYGIETKPINWRLLSSLLKNKPNELAFGEVNDTFMINKANKLRNKYIGEIARLNELIQTRDQMWKSINGPFSFLCNSFFSWLTIESTDFAFAGRHQREWQRGLTWLDNSEEYWKEIIMDKHVTKDSLWEIEMVEIDDPFSGNKTYEWQSVLKVYDSYHWDESDGIVTKDNAQLKDAIHNFEAAGANHQEVRNHPSTIDIFNKLFEGNKEYLDLYPDLSYFKL